MIYPKDAEFVNNIINITITLDEHVGKATNVPFCPIHNIFINPIKNNRKEEIILLTKQFHLNFLSLKKYYYH